MARYIHMVSDELREQGHEVEHIFAPEIHRNAKSRGYLDRFLTPLRVERAIRERIKSGKTYDLVDIHEPIAAYYAWKRKRNRQLPPLLVSVYGLECRSHLARLDYLKRKNRPIGSKIRYSPLSVVWQANYALRNADHVTVETTEDLDYLRSTMGIPGERITQQLGGVSLEFFEAGDSHQRDGLLFAATWIERKGVPEVVSALSWLADEFPAMTLTVAGAGVSDEVVLNSFPESFRRRIRFALPTDDNRALAKLFQSHAVFLLPSSFEGLPLVLLEAAAAGMAIVTTNVCGMRDVVCNDVNGLIVPVGDASALANAVRRLLNDRDLRTKLGVAARESMRTYTWENSTAQYLEACRKLSTSKAAD